MSGAIGSASYVLHPVLRRVSAAWTDTEIVTVRKMAAAGETAEDIGAAIGKSGQTARNIIKRNNLSWPKKSLGRHIVQSAAIVGSYISGGAYDWHAKALEMRRSGASQKEISEAFGVNPNVVSRFLRQHGLGRVPLAADKRADRHIESRRVKALGTLPKLPNTGKYLAQDNTGQWFYINHAGTWQTCPPPLPSPPVAA